MLKNAISEEAKDSSVPTARLEMERFETATLERDYIAAASYLAQVPPETSPEDDLFELTPHPKEFHEALLALASNSAPMAREQSLRAAEAAIRARATRIDAYDGAKPMADLAITHALLGRKEQAVHEAMQAVGHPENAPGLIEQNSMLGVLALIYAHTGEHEKAIDLIEHLLRVPCELQTGAVYNLTLTDLKWRWLWDPLRTNPRFEKLLAGPEPKTVY